MQAESGYSTTGKARGIAAGAGVDKEADEEIVAEALQGSNEAFGILFERYEKRMFHVAVRVLRNREDAEDAVQQAFQSAFVHLNSFQGNSRFSTWLTRIAINEALMLLRKRRPVHMSLEGNTAVDEEEMMLEIKDAAATPEEQCGAQELHAIVIEAIGELKPILGTVVQLIDIGEKTTQETAKALGIPRGTIKARAFRARRLLRRKLTLRLGLTGSKPCGPLFLESRAGRGNRRQTSSIANAI